MGFWLDYDLSRFAETDALFSHMMKKTNLYEQFLKKFYPDVYALKQLLFYTEFLPIEEWDLPNVEMSKDTVDWLHTGEFNDSTISVNAIDIQSGELNNNMLKQLKLKPNIRK